MASERRWAAALTARETEILRLISLGLSNRDIAEELVVAPATIRWYIKQIYSKLGVSGRVQAVNYARSIGLLQDGVPAQPEPVVASPAFQTASLPNLPVSLTPFVGRSREIEEVKHLLHAVRLLTLTGVGGAGKTQLALRVALTLTGDFADGVYFVDLAPLSDHNLVTKTIADVLGVLENPPEPQLNTLIRALAGRQLLLVVDNFEHVIEAATPFATLLASAPHLKALITSREALRLSGEQEYPVPPLSLPADDSPDALAASEAVSLFVQQVRLMLPGFEVTDANAAVITQVCARLDGLPLAIELAAARCKSLTPQALLDRLDSRLSTLTVGARDAPQRQQSLRRTLDWSYNLLDAGEQTLFGRLGVFRGGRSLEAVEAICQPGLPLDVFDGLAALVDKSLIQQKEASGGEPRFVMLETIHEYARERLAESSDAAAIRRRYAEYFVTLAERAEPELRLAEHAVWSHRLELELNNLRAVFEWSLGGGDIALGVRLGGALCLFWWAHGYHVEGRHWTQKLLERLDEVPVIHHAKFLLSAGHMALINDIGTAAALFTRMVDVSHKLGDRRLVGWALMYLGYAMLEQTEEATTFAHQGLTILRELDDRPGIAQALNIIGEIARFAGNDTDARHAYEACLTVAEKTGETRRVELALANLALLAQHEGDHIRAIELARQALELARDMNNRLEIGRTLSILAGSIGAIGQSTRAVHILAASEAAFGSMGAFHVPSDKPELNRIMDSLRVQLDSDSFEAAWAEGRAMTLDQAVAAALEVGT